MTDNTDMQQQMVTTLQSTQTGRQRYEVLCQRQLHLKELVSNPNRGNLKKTWF